MSTATLTSRRPLKQRRRKFRQHRRLLSNDAILSLLLYTTPRQDFSTRNAYNIP